MRRLLGVVAAMQLAALPVGAHRGHDALILVTVLPTGEVRVAHRLEAHDIEPALAEIAPGAQSNLDDPEAITALVAYLGRTFTIASEHGPIVLVPGPVEIGGADVEIGLVGKARRPIRRLTISARMLTDVHPGQINQVNVRYGSIVRTLTFTGGGAQRIDLDAE